MPIQERIEIEHNLRSYRFVGEQAEALGKRLDAARDALVDDAKVKGWDMLLNRRVSMNQSFQFIRQGRVVWIELNLVTPRELAIEYSLMPEQPGLSKK